MEFSYNVLGGNNMIKKEFLENEYLKKKKPMNQIAKENNIAVGTVYNYIKLYNIPSRIRMTEETKKKISNSNKGKPSPRKGIKMSAETKEKLSKAKKGKYLKPSIYGGHKKQRSDGYIHVYNPNHPNASKDGYIMEHILIMEEHIKRTLKKGEVVHHKNSIKNDNRIENLQLMTIKEHARYHMIERHKNKQKKG